MMGRDRPLLDTRGAATAQIWGLQVFYIFKYTFKTFKWNHQPVTNSCWYTLKIRSCLEIQSRYIFCESIWINFVFIQVLFWYIINQSINNPPDRWTHVAFRSPDCRSIKISLFHLRCWAAFQLKYLKHFNNLTETMKKFDLYIVAAN